MKRKKDKKTKKMQIAVGKRKEAIARAIIKDGSGVVKINNKPLNLIENEMIRLKIQEPIILGGDEIRGFDISVNVRGGGVNAQADAVRQAIAKAIVQKVPKLKQTYLEYDRSLLVADIRRKEQHKPPHSSWGARRYKQRSKR